MVRCSKCTRPVSEGDHFCPACGAPLVTPTSAPTEIGSRTPLSSGRAFAPGTMLGGRYRIVAFVGRGGMGEVYRADDLRLGETVALKFLPEDVAGDPSRRERFDQEVRLARTIAHPNVCRVYDVGESDGRTFLTMEYVDGEDLVSLLRRIGRLPSAKGLEVARQLCAGLSAAHESSVLHRDLKPANVMIDGRGHAKITDFGLAVADTTAAEALDVAGTPAYMAPEQLAGQPATVRSDLYALGLVLYEVFTGKHAFKASSLAEWRSVHTSSLPSRPSSHVSDLDPAAEAALLRCLEKDPERRPASAAQLAAMLPGGDPLEAAIRAGETPSPEMVAAAREEESLSPAKAWALFSLVLLSAAVAIFFGARATGLDQVAMELSPEVLRERAREIALRLGDDVPPRSFAWWIEMDRGYARLFQERGAPSLAESRPPAVRFVYRQSPRTILPHQSDRNLPTSTNPVPFWSGEAYVVLDLQGQLLGFSRIVRESASSESERIGPIDWGPPLSLAGADATRLRPVEPLWTPDVACDTRSAWVRDDTGASIRYEAAAWRGKPVWFRTIAPWERAERDLPTTPRDIGTVLFVVIACVTLLAFVFLVRHNLRLGRSDTRGALRVAAAVFACYTLADLLTYRWEFGPLRFWEWLWGLSYFAALIAWLFYLGVEPFLRRRWPRRLIASTRLLDGRIADPLVGREVLLGCLAGAGMVLAQCFPTVLKGGQDLDFLIQALPLGRATDFWGAEVAALGDSLMKGFGSFAVVLLLRVLFRRDSIAWMGIGLVLILIRLPSLNLSPAEWISLVAAAACLVAALRVGVVAGVVAAATENLTTWTPLTLDFSRWYAWRTAVVAVLLFAIAAWGFRAIMGRRRILSGSMLEG